jgi:hypothetical protein
MKVFKRLCIKTAADVFTGKRLAVYFILFVALSLIFPASNGANATTKITSIEAQLSSTASLSIVISDGIFEMGGFDFLINYYAPVLTPSVCSMGQLITDCDWEYFTYQYLASDMLRLRAIADINNGDDHPYCYGPPDNDPHELARISFIVTSEEWAEGIYLPLRFYWTDCDDNVISSVSGDTDYVSNHVYDFDGTYITDSTYGFPTYFGIQTGCTDTGPEEPIKTRVVDFMNGGVLIYGDWLCGDPNGDWTINIFDITMLITYLYLDGPPPIPMISADVNNDSMVNIFDITALISFLYLEGVPPDCPE